MKLYKISFNETDPEYCLSIDPGLKTAGLTLLDKKTGKIIKYQSFKSDTGSIRDPVPKFIHTTLSLGNRYMKDFDISYEKTQVCIECSFYGGQFSSGMMAVVTSLIWYFQQKNVPSIWLVPPKISQYFVKNHKAKGKEITSFVRNLYKIEKRINQHIADSILISCMVNYDILEPSIKNQLRVPDNEIIYL